MFADGRRTATVLSPLALDAAFDADAMDAEIRFRSLPMTARFAERPRRPLAASLRFREGDAGAALAIGATK